MGDGFESQAEGFADVAGYQLVERLGVGGMGTVYRARHAMTGGEYALKLLTPGDPALTLRFQREGEAQAAVDGHPNVLRVHAAGCERGRAYLVMDLAEGGDLNQRLRRGSLPASEAAALVRDLARGLAHVHARGVLHRDLKPANVLFDGEGRGRLTDFGLASLRGADRLTQTGSLMGTPAYMAPEQAAGSGGTPVDERSDVYGLGAILYHCLTGAPPFGGGSVLATLNQVVNEDPTPPRRLRPDVPPALEAICLRALAKEPGERQPGAEALAQELEAFLDAGEGARARRGQTAVVAALAALALVAVTGALAYQPPSPATQPPPPAGDPPAPAIGPPPAPPAPAIPAAPAPRTASAPDGEVDHPRVAAALALLEEGELAAALRQLRVAAEDGSRQANLHLARLFLERKDAPLLLDETEAKGRLQQVLDQDTSRFPYAELELLTRLLIRSGWFPGRAVERFRELISHRDAQPEDLSRVLDLALHRYEGEALAPWFALIGELHERIPGSVRRLGRATRWRDRRQSEKALEELRRLAHDEKVPEALYQLGINMAGIYGEESREVYAYFNEAAERGHPGGMLGLATYFEANDRVLEARRWYRQAGKKGNDRARIRLAFLSEEFEPMTAVGLYEQVLAHEGALPKDLKNAAYRLALLLLDGRGAPADPLRAGELLELAAGYGHERARTHLRRMRERGRIPPATGDGGGKR